MSDYFTCARTFDLDGERSLVTNPQNLLRRSNHGGCFQNVHEMSVRGRVTHELVHPLPRHPGRVVMTLTTCLGGVRPFIQHAIDVGNVGGDNVHKTPVACVRIAFRQSFVANNDDAKRRFICAPACIEAKQGKERES